MAEGQKTAEYRLPAAGDIAVAAVSGGCDSVCLLLEMAALAKQRGFFLAAVHVNHGIRGPEADGDEEFVRQLCAREGVPFTAVHADAPACAAQQGLSLEEAARSLRYGALLQAAEKLQREAAAGTEARPRVLIMTAHHRDDQAETVLLNLLRGSGIRGLTGMRELSPRGNGIYIYRPFLQRSRAELQQLLRAKGQTWREDSTNGDTAYRRNYLRRELLPEAEERFPGAGENIAEAAALLAETEDWLEQAAGELFENALTEDGGLLTAALEKQPAVLRQRVLRRWLLPRGGVKDVGRVHYRALEELLCGQSGRSLDLPGGRRVLRNQQALVLQWDGGEKQEAEPMLPALSVRRYPREKDMEILRSLDTVQLDCDMIRGSFSLRTRRPGDYFILASGGRKSLKSYLIDKKIPLERRDRMPLVAEGSHVLWLIGCRISDAVRVTDQTKTILELSTVGADGPRQAEAEE